MLVAHTQLVASLLASPRSVIIHSNSSLRPSQSGSCYLIDFRIELGGQTEESRTVFGNPANDQDLGWQTGTFFMYDPEVQGEGVEYSEPTDWLKIIVLSAAGFLLIGIVVTCCYCCKKRKSRQQTAEANLTGVQLA